MTQWETIHDQSSHISPPRLVQLKDYSTDRGNGIFEAVSMSFIETTPNSSQHQFIKKPRSTLMKLVARLVLLCIPVLLFLGFYAQDTTLYTQQLYRVKRTIQYQVTQSFSSTQKAWIDMARHSVYTPSRIIYDHYKQIISPIITSNEKIIKQHWLLWKKEYEAYVYSKMDYISTEIILDQKVKKTAEWIREYIHPPRGGMPKKDADEKAQEIVKSISRNKK